MLDQNDIQKIGELLEKTESNVVIKVGEVIEQNVLPAIDAVDKSLNDRIDSLGKRVANLPDKAYIDDKFADLEGTTVVRQRKEDQKVNLLIEILRQKDVLADQEVDMLSEIEVFPRPPKV